MFITKHLLALVALAVGAASSCDVCSKELYEGKCGACTQEAKGKWDDWMVEGLETLGCVSNVCCASNEEECCEASCDVCSKKLYDGKCGVFTQEAKGKWDDWMVVEGSLGYIEDACCASNEDMCCEANVGAILGLVIGLVVVIGGSIFACCKYRQNDETYGVAVPPGKLENCRRIHAPMRDWYAAPAQRSLKAKHGNFPRDPEVLSAWSSYEAVVTAFLDSAPGRENDSV